MVKLERRKCFGTKEHSDMSPICKKCHERKLCCKTPKKKKIITRIFKDYRLYQWY